MTQSNSIPVCLVQRSIPHYRAPLFRRLSEDPRFAWMFYCSDHDADNSSGLSISLDGLDSRNLSQKKLLGPLVWQSGIVVDRSKNCAIVCDYGWTILSNPILFARARAAGVATIGWSKGVAQDRIKKKSPVRRAFERSSVSLCDALIVYGQGSRDYFRDLGVSDERIFVAQNTIDTVGIAARRESAAAAGADLRRSLGLDDRPVLGFLGKIGPAKRVDLLIESFEKAIDNGVDAQLLIAGRGPSGLSIDAQLAASRHAARMVRLSDVPPGAEDGVFKAMDYYVSFAEPGLGIIEAMAHGTPIVATPERFPETEHLIDGETAYLSVASTVDSLAIRIGEAVRSAKDRLRISEAARAKVLADATLEGMVDAICHAVSYALARRGERSLSGPGK